MGSWQIFLVFLFPFYCQCYFDPTFGNPSYPKYNETALEQEMIQFEEEKLALKFFREKSELNELIGRRVIYHGIRRGWYNTSEYLIKNYYNPNNIDLYMTFVEARKKLDSKHLAIFERLAFLLPQDSIFLNDIQPCYLWAQDMHYLYIKVKFSPKIDTPGFMEIFRINVTITSYEIMLSAISLDGDLPVKFSLYLRTYRNMDPEPSKSFWSRKEMGTIEITIEKSPRPYFWKNLLENMFEDPPNQYLWWDMLYEKRKDIEEAIILFEAREMQRDDIDEEKLIIEDQRVLDIRYLRQREKMEEERENKDRTNRQYCWDLGYKQKCIVANPMDWHAWFF